MTRDNKPVLALTLGDINGIGPEVVAKTLARPELWQLCRPIVLGAAGPLTAAQESGRDSPAFCPIRDVSEALRLLDSPRTVPVWDCGAKVPPQHPGSLDRDAAHSAVTWIKNAARLTVDGTTQGMVTAPINKEGLHRAGYPYRGHTDLIAELTGAADYRMCLFTDTMRIVHLSGHCPLADALALISVERVETSVRIADAALRRLGTPSRRIAVAGLNPHAGEAGAFGREELDILAPAVSRCKDLGYDCRGPYPPDTVFARMRDGEFDLVIAMYHDQGHIPLKLIAMNEGVNVTLGIPIVRTSPDHGTAYEIAGQGRASDASMFAAVKLAARFAASGPGDAS